MQRNGRVARRQVSDVVAYYLMMTENPLSQKYRDFCTKSFKQLGIEDDS